MLLRQFALPFRGVNAGGWFALPSAPRRRAARSRGCAMRASSRRRPAAARVWRQASRRAADSLARTMASLGAAGASVASFLSKPMRARRLASRLCRRPIHRADRRLTAGQGKGASSGRPRGSTIDVTPEVEATPTSKAPLNRPERAANPVNPEGHCETGRPATPLDDDTVTSLGVERMISSSRPTSKRTSGAGKRSTRRRGSPPIRPKG